MSSEKWLSLLLKINAVILMLAFPAVLLPTDWMARIHEQLALGDLPTTPLVGYLTRSVSGIYGLFGIATWILSTRSVSFSVQVLGLVISAPSAETVRRVRRLGSAPGTSVIGRVSFRFLGNPEERLAL